MLQAFRRDRRRNTAEFFFEKAEGQDQSPPFVGHFGAAAMRTAGAGGERRARQKIIDRVDRIPGGLVAEPCFFRRLGDALVLHHGFEQGNALASDKKPSPGAPGQQAIYLSRQATRHSVLSKSAGRLELSSATPNIIQVSPVYRSTFWHGPVARAGANRLSRVGSTVNLRGFAESAPSKLCLPGAAKWTEGLAHHKRSGRPLRRTLVPISNLALSI